ncbi:BQ2448_4722 [Microbotryum intermedium]|uniref:glutathione peroxidase n=1 Tax=Microbotryum intermedium TaxID=269621 RepID=A0A238FLH3_9BASI|nr:BQ2448_4722 [Microbotryum intermedium]
MPIALARRRTCLAFALALVVASIVLMALRPTLLSSSSRLLSQSTRNGAAHLSSASRPKVVGAAADRLPKQQQQPPAPAAARAQPAAAPVGGAPLPPVRPFSNQAAAKVPLQAKPPADPEPATLPQADHKMSVKQTVDKHIKDSHVVVFSKSYCPYCKATKQLLNDLDAKATVFELDQMEEGKRADWQAYLGEKTGQRTVPSVWIDGDFIGGNSDVQSAHTSGKLQKLLKQ